MRRYDDLNAQIQRDLAAMRGEDIVVVEEVVVIEEDGYEDSWEYSDDGY